ncbi:MAG: EF-Tu/IF-2/RF-3 family GTPase [Coprobacillaceae bacterium]
MGLIEWIKDRWSTASEDNESYRDIEKEKIDGSRKFEFLVQDVFYINGKGVVVTGEVSLGKINVNDTVLLEKSNGQTKEIIINGIETFREMKQSAEVGENVGIMLKNAKRKEVINGNRLYR